MQKNVAFPSGFLCNSLLNKRTLLCSIKFFHTLFLENEEKTNETKKKINVFLSICSSHTKNYANLSKK